MLQKEQWLEVRAMELDLDADFETIQISAIEVEQLLPEANEMFKEKAMLDDQYRELCKQVTTGGNNNKGISINNELLCGKNRMYAAEAIWQRIIRSEHDSKVAGHFGRERTMEVVTRNFYWANMERDIRKYCNGCNICQRTKHQETQNMASFILWNKHANHGRISVRTLLLTFQNPKEQL
jgi:hypothetical protein